MKWIIAGLGLVVVVILVAACWVGAELSEEDDDFEEYE